MDLRAGAATGGQRLTALVLVSLSLVVLADAQDLKDLARDTKDSVLALAVFDGAGRQVGQGTGFYVGERWLVTNQHVVDSAARVVGTRADGEQVEVVGILRADPRTDLALLETAAIGPALRLAVGTIEPGERVVVLGNPLGLAGTLSEGIVSAVRPADPEAGADGLPALLQISAAISPGSSGSPVMTLDGAVIGVAVSQYAFGQNLNFAVPAAAVEDLMRRALDAPERMEEEFRDPEDAKPWGAYLRNVAISLVLIATVGYWLRRMG